jgi:orotidine-5'-phosphate decarboxylase
MGKLIEYRHSIVPACDVKTTKEFKNLVKQTFDIEGIGAYKIGSILAVRYGIPMLVKTIRKYTDLPVIYDHQKAMTDISDIGKDFAAVIKETGIDALIGFPLSGPETEETWIRACKDAGIEVIIGGEMTHPRYKRSEGGFIADESLDQIYLLAASLGINNFVVPGNKVERVIHYKSLLRSSVGETLTFFAPGFVAQGGIITEVTKAIKDLLWHAIVGRAIYGAQDIRAAAKEMTSHLSRMV